MSEAARSRRPDLRFEPQMERQATGSPGGAVDPLAELARLVGHDDPFRNLFNAQPERRDLGGNPARAEPQVRTDGRAPYRDPVAGSADPAFGPAEHAGQAWDDANHPQDAHEARQVAYGGEQARYDAADGQHVGYDAQHDGYDVGEAGADQDHQGYEEATDYAAPPLTPDLWAGQLETDDYADSGSSGLSDETAPSARAPRRPLIVLAAVLVLTGGGLAATFVARSGTGAAVLGRETPTILAATGPNKIKQVDPSADSTPEDADGALLNRNSQPPSGPVKVVNSQEQPTDLTQLPKVSGAGDGQPAGSSSSGSPFPEPKRVKTFLVRPDGTMISSGGASAGTTGSVTAPSPSALPSIAAISAGDDAAAPPPVAAAPAAAPRPATPKSNAKAATTPKAVPTSIADAAASADAGDPAAPGKARQASSAGVKSGKAKPIEVADASASIAPPSTGQGGAYGLQLAAAPTEQEARDLFAKLQKKYSSELGAYRPTIHKADSGDRSIYRLRVGNLTQDQAKSICSQLQTSGGSCFVVRN